MTEVEVVIVGAGVIGLATARELARRGHEVVIVERERVIGLGVSARNSGVIHAGIYYAKGSLKAQFCGRGRDLLYRFCLERDIGHRRCGKLVVAVSQDEMGTLARLHQHAAPRLGDDLIWLDQRGLTERAPQIRGVAALQLRTTGIVDTDALMCALLADACDYGATLLLNTPVNSIAADGSSTHAILQSGVGIRARHLINAAGLDAVTLANTAGSTRRSVFAKGSYFRLTVPPPTDCLIYPLPQHGGLGIHLTLDLLGRGHFGPDVELIEKPEFSVDPARADAFYAAIRRYWPSVPNDALEPAFAGVRPKLANDPYGDFVIERSHGLINLLGFESPGLTASLAIAEHVGDMISAQN